VQIPLGSSVQNTVMDWTAFLTSVVFLVAAFFLAPIFNKIKERTQGRLDDWAKSEAVTIISQRGVRFYEGPSAWVRTENQNVYRLEVRDRKGQVRLAWVTFGKDLLSSEINPEISKVTWG
jgi:hypothetical protein